MIIYNKEWVHNMRIVDGLKDKLREGSITPEEFIAVKTVHPFYFYLPRLVIRVGLFILTFIIASFATGLLSLLGLSTHMIDSPGWPIFLGAVCYGALEFFVKENRFFHSGVDNALLYYSACLFGGGFIWMISKMYLTVGDNLPCAIIICLLCIYLTLRFADVLTTLVACIAFFAVVYFTWAKAGSFGLATMPFMMMIAAGMAFYLINKLGKDIRSINYESCIDYAKIISLIALYAAGNYFVVNRLNNMLNNLDDSHTSIPLGFIFWIWTMLVPVAYTLLGIRKKSAMFLRLGMVLAAASIATFRNYYHLLPIEAMLTLSGMILLAASYTIIKYLKTPHNGITYAEPEERSDFDKLNIEALIVGQATSHLPTPAQHPTDRFGGGTGGGGGSSGKF
ncbi:MULTISPECIES: hypothetical protein [unclassified Mucilaginibacter]|uniref:hypothetical protein n=1 Tax=unclassified Mucilaginibacter TaxID=2617802 RepID=UPI002AC8BD13|nr:MULTISPECIES: hypothetical protein [unclassified Mucilaginibacter]MEB0260564.1 hypothetical protein [Mucilaginibacter sp. 10I4]MEB0278080.1 hypothetical protein [Mucilaginibacter sp. 10B2]MEB0302943.1 hypothetical protein [Mucilaginibacter sp. 5C4]WPX22991.1 hypothetical protein RHM67_17055 [Mucilaginibacter sp. 5C4]